ncbi:GNAT family N-acetyltransferase [Paraburkholderia susongensis]|uniref:Ribosomal protein S18 acetylase RimI n=1 Tax=Paraburkholderia susongensis TaxID=1515439 RepID=A0A1X7KY55_9BURK|nr:GNAT family N-acetyltransferase [Paraburkholderia susongensis]SMG45972.1 Ribosomal protein S18 acetylase RimI [Paraburkholderia susongensis]
MANEDIKSGLEVRRVTNEDTATVTHLVGALFAELHEGDAVPEYRLESVENVLRDSGRSFGFIAIDDESAIGILLLTEGVAVFAGGAFGQITELYVDPKHRSRGIASLLVSRAAAFGRERGWKRMDVGAPHQPRWSRSLHFYESEGFVEVGPRLRLDL